MSASGAAASAGPKEKTNEEFCALIAQVMDILHEETYHFKSHSKQKRLVKRLKSAGLSPHKQHTGDFLWAYNWITTKFNKDIYEDTTEPHPNTGKGLIWVFYYHFVERYRKRVFRSPEEIAASKLRSEARKARNVVKKAATQRAVAAQKKVSVKKKMAKEKQERLRLGGGDEELGNRRFQERMNVQSKEKDRKAAVKVSGDARKLLDFWEWRLQTDEGKCYDIPLHAASFKSFYASYVHHKSTKRFLLKPEDAVKTLQFLLDERDERAKNPKITFNYDSTGKVHFYGVCHRAVNPDHHITVAPVVALHYKKLRKTPGEISGAITGCKLSNGEFYIQTKNECTNMIPLLPPKWNDFKAVADKVIGSKRYKAQPNRGVNVPFMLKVLDPTAIKTLEWTDGHTKYVATVDVFGKDLAYVKSLCKTQKELEAEELRKMKEAAEVQKQEKRQRAIQREFWRKQTENNMSAYFDNMADCFSAAGNVFLPKESREVKKAKQALKEAELKQRLAEARKRGEDAEKRSEDATKRNIAWLKQMQTERDARAELLRKTTSKFCTECGKRVDGQDKFCKSCGTKTG